MGGHDDSGNWYRSYGNENWEFDANGEMRRRLDCINDLRVKESVASFSGRRAVVPTAKCFE